MVRTPIPRASGGDASVQFVPVDAIDTTTRMAASAIYAAPNPAEA